MPNLVPPLTLASDAMAYKNRIQQLEPNLNILLTLYLHESITPAVVRGAKAQGIVGIKVYPAGVTTNSKSGVSSYEPFYPVFRGQSYQPQQSLVTFLPLVTSTRIQGSRVPSIHANVVLSHGAMRHGSQLAWRMPL